MKAISSITVQQEIPGGRLPHLKCCDDSLIDELMTGNNNMKSTYHLASIPPSRGGNRSLLIQH
jgi:hypothetical protein